MIMHTIVTDEDLYQGIDQLQPPEEVWFEGNLLQVERMNTGQARIVRMISPDPMMYLDPRFCPGQMIDLSAVH